MVFFPGSEPLGDLFGWPIYDPPYDSPIEDIFAYHVVKYLGSSTKLHPQFPVHTDAGSFFLDFLIERGQYRIAVECDGAAYHDFHRDQWRDALILGTGRVGAIYRFGGRLLMRHIDDCLVLMAKWDRSLFSERALLNLETLASDAMRAVDFLAEGSTAFVRYLDERNERCDDEILERRSLDRNGVNWRALIARAAQYPGRTLDQIISAELGRSHA
jgi:hypothetical protein